LIDSEILNYDHDEEELAFGEPDEGGPKKGLSILEKIFLFMVFLGITVFLLLVSGILDISGKWSGFLLSYLPFSAGLSLYFWAAYSNTTPGIKHDNNYFRGISSRGLSAWFFGLVFTAFYVVLYWWPQYISSGVRTVDPLSMLLAGSEADRWFFYGFLYTIAVIVFGVRMLMKYRHSRYQQIRTLSVMFFQLGFAFIIPNVLKLLNQPEYYFSYFWPLKYNYLFPGDIKSLLGHPGGLGIFFIFWGLILTFIATPVLTYLYGKRWYCSWVCGCGGLAETMGDPWRQLSDKSVKAWRIERWSVHTVLVLVTVVTAMLWINSVTAGKVLGSLSHTFAGWYGFFIGGIFSGVIGVGFYPLMGSRVWCRFGCPLAAILGIFQRFYSRFRITTNGEQCMSCGNCSTYCEMGIDVRSYAQEGKNIVRASCVGCGVCVSVCPRGVLRLEGGETYTDRFEGADNPVKAFIDSIKHF